MVKISLMGTSEEKPYTLFLKNSNESMFFHSVPYKKMLEEFLSVKSFFLIAKENERIIGALPLFLKKNEEYGNILNSSPFIGSNGGFITDSHLDFMKQREIKQNLLQNVYELADTENCILSTIISSPFDRDMIFYEDFVKYSYRDYRVSYIKHLNYSFNSPEESILKTVDKRCRNTITRSMKNLEYEYSDDFETLFTLHRKNMEGKGAFKPWIFFKAIKKYFSPDQYELTYALQDGKRVAGLLVFFFKDTVEYFTPAFNDDFRKEQPTSFLIFHSMKNASQKGFKYWNFGGTRLPSQTGVASFKKSWGSFEYPYYYYTIRHQDSEKILKLSSDVISEHYRWFYVIPF